MGETTKRRQVRGLEQAFSRELQSQVNLHSRGRSGLADLGCYVGEGAPHDVLRNIDLMAREGIRFTDALANSPVAALLGSG